MMPTIGKEHCLVEGVLVCGGYVPNEISVKEGRQPRGFVCGGNQNTKDPLLHKAVIKEKPFQPLVLTQFFIIGGFINKEYVNIQREKWFPFKCRMIFLPGTIAGVVGDGGLIQAHTIHRGRTVVMDL